MKGGWSREKSEGRKMLFLGSAEVGRGSQLPNTSISFFIIICTTNIDAESDN